MKADVADQFVKIIELTMRAFNELKLANPQPLTSDQVELIKSGKAKIDDIGVVQNQLYVSKILDHYFLVVLPEVAEFVKKQKNNPYSLTNINYINNLDNKTHISYLASYVGYLGIPSIVHEDNDFKKVLLLQWMIQSVDKLFFKNPSEDIKINFVFFDFSLKEYLKNFIRRIVTLIAKYLCDHDDSIELYNQFNLFNCENTIERCYDAMYAALSASYQSVTPDCKSEFSLTEFLQSPDSKSTNEVSTMPAQKNAGYPVITIQSTLPSPIHAQPTSPVSPVVVTQCGGNGNPPSSIFPDHKSDVLSQSNSSNAGNTTESAPTVSVQPKQDASANVREPGRVMDTSSQPHIVNEPSHVVDEAPRMTIPTVSHVGGQDLEHEVNNALAKLRNGQLDIPGYIDNCAQSMLTSPYNLKNATRLAEQSQKVAVNKNLLSAEQALDQLKKAAEEYRNYLILKIMKFADNPYDNYEKVKDNLRVKRNNNINIVNEFDSISMKIRAVEALIECKNIEMFRNTFRSQRNYLEKSRDSGTVKFLKVVATILTVGFAAVFGIFRVHGAKATNKVESILNNCVDEKDNNSSPRP